MRRATCLVLAIVLAACSHTANTPPVNPILASFVGSTVPPYPAGFESLHGTCIGLPPDDVCAFSVGSLDALSGEHVAVFAARAQGRGPDGRKALWLVTDAIPAPGRARDQHFVAAACTYKGTADTSVLAIVGAAAEGPARASGWAYKLDFGSGKFVRLDPADVACTVPAGED